MSISFNSIPTNLRVPFVTAEFDSSRAAGAVAQLQYRALLIGQKTSAGTATANTVVKVTNVNQALLAGGRGSQLHRMAIAWFAINKSTEVYLGVLDDNGGGVAATKTLTFTGTATAAGTLSVYIGGELVQVAVASGDAHTDVAAALNTALGLKLDLPVSSGVAAGVVTLTARNKGVAGQDLNVRLNYQDGEATPAGIACVIANAIAGATNPTLSTLISALGDTWYHVIAHPYYDATSLSAIETELSSRFGPTRMIDGFAITCSPGTTSALGTLGDSRNSQHSIIVSQPGDVVVSQCCEFAAATAAAAALSLSADPARPLQTLVLTGMKAPSEADLFTLSERNLLLYDGIATTKVVSGVVQIERLVTTYQTNSAGASDVSYLDVNTMATLMYARYSFRTAVLNAFPRHKLADDGTRFGAGQAVVTPKIMKAFACLWFRQLESLGLVENYDQFAADLVVERNALDRNRLDILLSPDLINQLIVSAIKIQFVL